MSNTYIPKDKMSKKAQRMLNREQRTLVKFNTGTIIHKTDKHPSRARAKQIARKACEY